MFRIESKYDTTRAWCLTHMTYPKLPIHLNEMKRVTWHGQYIGNSKARYYIIYILLYYFI